MIHGWASFVDAHTLSVEKDDGVFETVTFNKAIITVGSRPYRPDILDFDHPRVFDSDKILQMDYVVKKSSFMAQALLVVSMPLSLLVLAIKSI